MDNNTNLLLISAMNAINSNNPVEAETFLDKIFNIDPSSLDAHNLREQHRLSGNFSDWIGVNAIISPQDDIYKFFVNHPTSRNPIRDYLSDGWRTMVELRDILDQYSISLHRCVNFLEFASGHGRFTRHLARILKRDQLTVSDVVPGSVDFLVNTFNAKGFYSTVNPDDLHITDKFDVIFVLSLFSHLPSTVWEQWIKVLYASVEPSGVLIFSTHGEKCAYQAKVDIATNGYQFFPSSESKVLDGDIYGTSFASFEYVKQITRNALGSKIRIELKSSHFWENQDAIIVSGGLLFT